MRLHGTKQMTNTYLITFRLGFHNGHIIVRAMNAQEAIKIARKEYEGFNLRDVKATIEA
jgi:hypothetical protein